jgi:PPOX class probable F420-dependent enzyme
MEKNKMQIFGKYLDLFEKKSFAHIATIMKNGSPQVSPVWVDYDGTHILVNTARGRQKMNNILRDPRVALSIQDPDNPYRKLLVRGRVVEETERDADEHIDRLAKKYTEADKYQNRVPGMVRVILKIKPEHVSG